MFGSTRSVPPLPEGWNHLVINLSNLAITWSQHSRMSTVCLAGNECAFNCHLLTPRPSLDPFFHWSQRGRASSAGMTRSRGGGIDSEGRASRAPTSDSARVAGPCRACFEKGKLPLPAAAAVLWGCSRLGGAALMTELPKRHATFLFGQPPGSKQQPAWHFRAS